MAWTEINEVLQHLAQPEYLYIGASALVLAIFLILLLRRQPKNVVAYITENGRVMVSRSAIVELVQTSCEQLQDVSKPHVKIKVKGKVTHFDVSIKLMSGGRLRSVEETLQTHLRHALTDNLGIENLGRINIVATGFKSGQVKQSNLTPTDTPNPTQDSPDGSDEGSYDNTTENER
jgi:hypothetical protein